MVPVLRTKAGVEFARIAPGGFRILAALDRACQVMARDLTITAGTNDHAMGRHVTGEAFDLSVKDLTVPEIVRLKTLLQQVLGARFAVLYEVPSEPADPTLRAIAWVNQDASGPHLHLQVTKGTVYPPANDGAMHA